MNASFHHAASGTTVTFSRDPERPGKSISPDRETDESAAGVAFGWAPQQREDLVEVPLYLTFTEYNALFGFFLDKAHGMAEPFTYTDVLGNAVDYRFASPELPAPFEAAADVFTLTVSLRAE